MGIKGLGTFLSTKYKSVVSKPFVLKPTDTLAIDLTLFIHRFYYTDTTNPTVESITERIKNFLKNLKCLKKILVIDGGVFEDAKKHAHSRRASAKESISKKSEQLEYRLNLLKNEIRLTRESAPFSDEIIDSHEYLRILIDESLKVELELETAKVRGDGLPKEMMRSVITMLETIPGIVLVRADEGEAEKHCAMLVRRGEADYVVTEDLDSLCFGAPFLVRGITSSTPTVICLATLLSELKLSMEEFVDFCILAGSDFTRNPPGFGPATALKAIKAHKDLTCLDVYPKKWQDDFRDEFIVEALNARRIFLG